MSTSYYSSGEQERQYRTNPYEQERQRKAAERAAAPKKCPHCEAPINQNLSEWDRVRYHCGSDRCRKAVSRANIAERKRQERSATRARILQYCEQQLDRDQKNAVMEMCDLVMAFDYHNGHNIALEVVKVIENKRCKHDRIAQLEQNAAIWKRKAQASEQQLKARIKELEEELELFNGLETLIHGIAARQLERQPDPPESRPAAAPEPEREDPDRARVLATLAHIGIQPYTGQEDPD